MLPHSFDVIFRYKADVHYPFQQDPSAGLYQACLDRERSPSLSHPPNPSSLAPRATPSPAVQFFLPLSSSALQAPQSSHENGDEALAILQRRSARTGALQLASLAPVHRPGHTGRAQLPLSARPSAPSSRWWSTPRLPLHRLTIVHCQSAQGPGCSRSLHRGPFAF